MYRVSCNTVGALHSSSLNSPGILDNATQLACCGKPLSLSQKVQPVMQTDSLVKYWDVYYT